MSFISEIKCMFGNCHDLVQAAADDLMAPLKPVIDNAIVKPLHLPPAQHPTPIAPDGQVSTFEEHELLSQAFDDYVPRFPSYISWDYLSALDIVESTIAPVIYELPLDVLKPVAATCDHQVCNDIQKIPFDYLKSEIRAAELAQRSVLYLDGTSATALNALTDHGNDPKFIQWAASLDYLPKGVMQDVRATVVDWVAADKAAPVILVWLDNHVAIPQQRTLLTDWVRLHSYDPLYGHEGVEKDDVLDSGIGRSLAGAGQHRQDALSFVNQEMIHGLKMMCQNSDPIIRLKSEQAITALYTALGDDAFSQGYVPDVNYCVYGGALKMVGYEDPLTMGLQFKKDDLASMVFHNNAAMQGVTIEIYRSQKAIDTMLDLMDDHGKKWAVMRMGRMHYPSLYDHAKQRHDVNVVFLRLDADKAYTGPLPTL